MHLHSSYRQYRKGVCIVLVSFFPLLLVRHGGILTGLGDFVLGMYCKEKLVLKLLRGETENSLPAQI